MNCILCIASSEDVIPIFGEKGSALHISEIIIKHFWLQPNADDENTRIICTSCWTNLEAFHKFYLQVEEAHVKLLKAKTIVDENVLKLESETGPHNSVFDAEPYVVVEPELLKADIKLEVQDDTELSVGTESQPDNDDDKQSSFDSIRKSSIDCKKSIENTRTTRSRTSTEKSYNDYSSDDDDNNSDGNQQHGSSTDWQDIPTDDDDDDSEYEDSNSKRKLKSKQPSEQPSATGRKRGRPKKGEVSQNQHKKKRISTNQSKKMERVREYDEIISKNVKLACANCLMDFPNFAVLKRHYRSAHHECGYATCCGKKFLKRGLLVDHIYTHQNPEYFKCDKCGKVLASRKNLDCHMLTHDSKKQRIYQCDQCTLSFFTRPLLTRHLQTHIPDRTIKCPDCDKFFSTQDILRTHFYNVHNAAYTTVCDQCGKLFRRPDAFRRHKLEHDGITQPLVPCGKCGVKLTSKYGLKRHMESMHPDTEVTHVCSTCGKVAPSAAALQRHVSYMHKMERKYKCPMCDKAFKKMGALKEHMTTHTGEVLYTCPHCPKTFNSNANMHSHRKKMHRTEWEANRRHPHMGATER